MELRLSTARATRDIDLTYLQRMQDRKTLSADFILNDLQELAATDLEDFFFYTLEKAPLDLDNAPYGGARYSVSSSIDGKLFVRFHLDVGGDILVSHTEVVSTPDWLSFCGVPAPQVRMISIEQQFAEKIHAYSFPRGDGFNSRVKDLIDLLLLIHMRPLDLKQLAFALHRIFKARNIHHLPLALSPPPPAWAAPYTSLAEECGIDTDINAAFAEIASLYSGLSAQLSVQDNASQILDKQPSSSNDSETESEGQ